MRIKAKVYRIANRFPDPDRAKWTGPPWAWDMFDLDAPIVRLDGCMSMIDWGYGDSWDEVMQAALRAISAMQENIAKEQAA